MGQGILGKEADRCRPGLDAVRSVGGTTSLAGALTWSLAAVVWGNGVVAAGRRLGHDEWISLVGVPLFGLAGWRWLARRGVRREAIGLRRPDQGLALTTVTLSAAVFVGVAAAAGVATFAGDGRGLRTVRTLVGTAFGEELVHRGVLLTVWAGTGTPVGGVVAANTAVFGLWHLVGADPGGLHLVEIIGPAVAAVPLVWLRLRSRSLAGPVIFHAATNIGGLFRSG